METGAPSDLGKTRQGSQAAPNNLIPWLPAPLSKLGVDKIERTCYYVHARLVSPLRGPAFWQSVTLGEKIVRKGDLFFALPGGSMSAIFHASLSALPGQKPSRRRASHPQLDKPENCQLRFANWRGRLLDHVT